MSDDIAIRLSNVGKMYRVFPNYIDTALDALGISRFMPWHRPKYQEFWALRGINLELKKGQRIGVVGRNGAGKSTLLKLISGNLPSTEGEIEVHGNVQALLDVGTGFHPEFTGYENIRASLTYQGLNNSEIKQATEEIAEFTELTQFLDRPFKTYSVGMQARLSFATATVINPEILIIDEILGAGDAYFFSKSTERMANLVEGGAPVLLVSHAQDQILRFCKEAIWLDRGRIVQRGPAIEIVKAYQEFIHKLEDRRLRAKNRMPLDEKRVFGQLEQSSDFLTFTFQVQGEPGCTYDVTEVTLLKDGCIEETLHVGDVQDTNPSHPIFITLENSQWSVPQQSKEAFFRSLTLAGSKANDVHGTINLDTYSLVGESDYALCIRYRTLREPDVTVAISRGSTLIQDPIHLSHSDDWTIWETKLERHHMMPATLEDQSKQEMGDVFVSAQKEKLAITRWGSGSSPIAIEKVQLLGIDGREQAVFNVGDPLTLSVLVKAQKRGQYDLVLTAPLFRLDGILISKFRTGPNIVEFEEHETREFQLTLDPLNLGNGSYIFSLGLFDHFIDDKHRLDLIDRSFEFQVVGNEPYFSQVIFHHIGLWKFNHRE